MINRKMDTLALTTAVLLSSCVPFLVLSSICTFVSAIVLFLGQQTSLWNQGILLIILLLALPVSWLSLRVWIDTAIMKHWSTQHDEHACHMFDHSLHELGLITLVQPRDLAQRAGACLGLQKRLLIIIVVQWVLFLIAASGALK